MRIDSKTLPKPFDPIAVTITIEDPNEAKVIRRALSWYLDNSTYGPYREVIERLIPAFTLL